MHKKRFLIAFIVIGLCSSALGQNLEPKAYSSILDGDLENNFSGIAVAQFIGMEKNVDKARWTEFKYEMSALGREVVKMTKNNYWLCWKALSEWELEDGELYIILCAKDLQSEEALIIFATIKDKKKSFDWWGRTLSKDDIQKLDDVMKSIGN